MALRTLQLTVDPENILSADSQASLGHAAAILRGGGTVAFPTETVYGLGANALDADAVGRIFEAKQRPGWDPLIVHIAREESLQGIVTAVSLADRTLMSAFWPGPLTLLMPRQLAVPDSVTAGRPLVGVRMPAHPVARRLIELAALPIAAPSANSFGRISPTTAQHVLEDLDGRIDAVLDGGSTTLGLESTVLDANTTPPLIYRHGMVPIEEIRQYLPGAVVFAPSGDAAEGLSETGRHAGLPSPGVGLRHYAPVARLVLVAEQEFSKALALATGQDGLIGALLPDSFPLPVDSHLLVFRWGDWRDVETLAQRLFLGLRELDQQGVVRILCPIPNHPGLGAALRDRLEKAAKPRGNF